LISIFLNNDPIIALSKASFFLLDFFFNWFPSIVLNDFLRVREALAVLIKSLVTGPTFAQEFTEEYWLVYINKIVTFTHKFERYKMIFFEKIFFSVSLCLWQRLILLFLLPDVLKIHEMKMTVSLSISFTKKYQILSMIIYRSLFVLAIIF